MNCLTLNIGSVHASKKWEWARKLCEVHKVMFLGLEETRMTQVDLLKITSVWGNINFDFATSSTRGFSGGILSIWDPLYFAKIRVLRTDNHVIVHGKWVSTNTMYHDKYLIPSTGW